MEYEEIKKIRVERTKTNLPALWEAGGGCTNTGESTIVADQNGRRKKPVYIRRAGHLSNSRHALIVLAIGDYIVKSYQKRKDFWIRIYKVENFDGEFAVTELAYEFKGGQWNNYPPASLQPAITAGMEKATCYHCREPHYTGINKPREP